MAIQPVATGQGRLSRMLARLAPRAPDVARVPDGLCVYAVGDIHGCATLLDDLHQAILADAANHGGESVIVYLGDYADRGPDSRGVIERLTQPPPRGFSARFLKGNHDAALLDFLSDAATYRAWRDFGAAQTLVSYGVRPPLFDAPEEFEKARIAFAAAMPQPHLRFFRELELNVVLGDYAFVHAGVRPGVAMERQREEDILWIRDEFLDHARSFGKMIVHGHTPVDAPFRLPNRIAVDTGAYATGKLSCAVLENCRSRFLTVQS